MPETFHTSTLIIGSGPAGYTASVYAARAMLNPILIQGLQPGGQLTITTDVENWPGDKMILGPDLMIRMEEHAKKTGVKVILDYVIKLELNERPFRAICDSGNLYTSDALILATGAQAKWLGLESEEYFKGFGVSACATCDGFFYREKEVVVIGGGNTAVEEALFLTNFAKKVTLVHRRDELRAEKILQNRLFNHPKIEVIWNNILQEIIGADNPKTVHSVRLKNIKTDKNIMVDCSGVFIAIGHSPASELVRGQLALREGGYIQTDPGTTHTTIPGVFAAGDLVDSVYRQAVTSAGLGCMAALDAEKFLAQSN